MPVHEPDALLSSIVVSFGVYVLLKFAFFFVLGYPARRRALDRAYRGRAHATGGTDVVLLAIAIALSGGLLADGAEPIGFLGGVLVGATLIQLYFHAFHAPLDPAHEAPEPRSPLKIMSYAIQAAPGRAWKELATFATLIVLCLVLHWSR